MFFFWSHLNLPPTPNLTILSHQTSTGLLAGLRMSGVTSVHLPVGHAPSS